MFKGIAYYEVKSLQYVESQNHADCTTYRLYVKGSKDQSKNILCKTKPYIIAIKSEEREWKRMDCALSGKTCMRSII